MRGADGKIGVEDSKEYFYAIKPKSERRMIDESSEGVPKKKGPGVRIKFNPAEQRRIRANMQQISDVSAPGEEEHIPRSLTVKIDPRSSKYIQTASTAGKKDRTLHRCRINVEM